MKNIVVLGCTGSIGDSVFKVLQALPGEFRVLGASGGAQVEKLAERARHWGAEFICVAANDQVERLQAILPETTIWAGAEGLVELATLPQADIVLNGLVGAVGLEPTLRALEAGKVVGMANKEPLVMAGDLLLQRAACGGGEILPLDSEPNALWQCLKGEAAQDVERLILTASGGPFFGQTRVQMEAITPQQALDHPTWTMGPKITVDSATLMNKGFEVIEASCLFGVGIEQIDVVIHRQSIVHSMVEFTDGSIVAHLGKTDMALPIQYALTHPRRQPSPLGRLDLVKAGTLTFDAPDTDHFPCLPLCYQVGRQGGCAPAVLNAANEVAVAAFLQGKIGFLDIAAINEKALEVFDEVELDSLQAVLEVDRAARRRAVEQVALRAGINV